MKLPSRLLSSLAIVPRPMRIRPHSRWNRSRCRRPSASNRHCRRWRPTTRHPPATCLPSTSALEYPLLGQIKAGAPVDLFISAADKQVNELIKDGLADAASRNVVARGRLALIVPAKQANAATSFKEVATDKVKRLAIGQPKTVPAGDYASQALAKADLSAAVSEKLVYGTNVRQVLDYVVRGEVDAGLVYATDAKDAGDAVKVVELIDPSLHDPIVYPAVVLKDAAHKDAADRFLKYLLSDAGRASSPTRASTPRLPRRRPM